MQRLVHRNEYLGTNDIDTSDLFRHSVLNLNAWIHFDEKPLILRIYGRGKCIHQKDELWDKYIEHFKDLPGARQIVEIEIDSVQNSCGYGVPILEFVQERDTLNNWSSKEGDNGIKDYWKKENLESIDGLETGMKDQLSRR